jgi:hypothetical protein
MRKKEDVIGEDPSLILLVDKFSSINSRQASILAGKRGYILAPIDLGAPSTNLMA